MWLQWYRSKTAWVIIITAVVALVGAFLCAYYLPYPLNLITAFVWCVPAGIIIRNSLLGRGGEQNLLAYYFKEAPEGSLFASDPDAIPELENIYFSNLRGKTFRDYVKGWKAKHYGGEPPIIVCMTKEAFFKNMTGEIPEDMPQEVFAQVMKEFIFFYPLIGYRRSWVGAPEGESDLYSIQSMPDDLYENRLTYQTLKSIALNYSLLIVDKRDKKIAELWTALSTKREEAIAYINQIYPEQITLEEFLA